MYRLARWRNDQGDGDDHPGQRAHQAAVGRAARPTSVDADNLPPYEELDPVLERYVEDDWTAAELVDAGFDEALVRRITRLVDVAEWKRRQAPVGPAGQPEGVRQGPPAPDHQRVPGLNRARPTAAAGASMPSSSTSPASWSARRSPPSGQPPPTTTWTRTRSSSTSSGPYAEDTDHAWHKAERGEIQIVDWITDTMSRAEADGSGLDLGFMASMLGRARGLRRDGRCRPGRCGRDGYKTSLLTNNIAEGRDSWRPLLPLDELFDDVVDSSEVGMRKPNPMIYRLALDRLGGIEPSRAVMLDDHPGNCGGARGVGMQAILVEDPAVAVDELMALLGR